MKSNLTTYSYTGSIIFCPEDGSYKLLRNGSKFLKVYRLSHPRRQQYSCFVICTAESDRQLLNLPEGCWFRFVFEKHTSDFSASKKQDFVYINYKPIVSDQICYIRVPEYDTLHQSSDGFAKYILPLIRGFQARTIEVNLLMVLKFTYFTYKNLVTDICS